MSTASEQIGVTQIKFLVSSKHLILASPVFSAMLLRPNFAKGLELQRSGHLDLPLFDDDPEALEIILNIIHGHPKNVPRLVDIQLLTKIAIIVDKYGTHEVMEHFSDLWIDQFVRSFANMDILFQQRGISTILSMICISWVFKRGDHFAAATARSQS